MSNNCVTHAQTKSTTNLCAEARPFETQAQPQKSCAASMPSETHKHSKIVKDIQTKTKSAEDLFDEIFHRKKHKRIGAFIWKRQTKKQSMMRRRSQKSKPEPEQQQRMGVTKKRGQTEGEEQSEGQAWRPHCQRLQSYDQSLRGWASRL